MTFVILLTFHVLLCVVLTGLVLLQQGKGADAGATFGGGGGSNTLFGAGGATDFITKLTTVLAILFMVTSILLVRSYQHGGAFQLGTEANPLQNSVMSDEMAGLSEEDVVEEEAVLDDAPVAAGSTSMEAEGEGSQVSEDAPAVDSEAVVAPKEEEAPPVEVTTE